MKDSPRGSSEVWLAALTSESSSILSVKSLLRNLEIDSRRWTLLAGECLMSRRPSDSPWTAIFVFAYEQATQFYRRAWQFNFASPNGDGERNWRRGAIVDSP